MTIKTEDEPIYLHMIPEDMRNNKYVHELSKIAMCYINQRTFIEPGWQVIKEDICYALKIGTSSSVWSHISRDLNNFGYMKRQIPNKVSKHLFAVPEEFKIEEEIMLKLVKEKPPVTKYSRGRKNRSNPVQKIIYNVPDNTSFLKKYIADYTLTNEDLSALVYLFCLGCDYSITTNDIMCRFNWSESLWRSVYQNLWYNGFFAGDLLAEYSSESLVFQAPWNIGDRGRKMEVCKKP